MKVGAALVGDARKLREGLDVPTSLLTSMIDTRMVSSRIAAARASGSTMPSSVTWMRETSKPHSSSSSAASMTAWCSNALMTT
jgi:hypothetical protein